MNLNSWSCFICRKMFDNPNNLIVVLFGGTYVCYCFKCHEEEFETQEQADRLRTGL